MSKKNLPDSVTENTPDAPWNEETKDINITVILNLDTEVSKKLTDDEIRGECIDQLNRSLYATDFTIEEIIIEE